MEYGGIIVVMAIAITIVVIVPHLVDRRTAITQSREADRFSPRMRLIDEEPALCHHSGDTSSTANSHCGSTPLLAHQALQSDDAAGADDYHARPALPATQQPAHLRGHRGDTMADESRSARRPDGTIHAQRDYVRTRELSRLRARRAARIASEKAAGQRRMILSGVCAAITVLMMLIAALTTMSWAWVLIPAAALAAGLGVSRWSAIRSQRVGEAEEKRIMELTRGTSARRNSAPSPVAPETVEHAPASETATDEGPDEALGADASTEIQRVDDEAQASHSVDDEDARLDQATRDVAQTQRAWSVQRIPAPTYASRQEITGRVVHADTDLRGIPQVPSDVRGRPIHASSSSGQQMRSTEEVAAQADVAFDLDAVLESRRAQ
ncbi:hypothetical protein [Schaalia radingae]|nr:hypothetical protein [Schaalia radingae]